MRIVYLVALKGTHTRKHGDEARGTLMVRYKSVEKFVRWHNKPLELSFRDLALFILPVFVLGSDSSVEITGVEYLKNDIEDDEQAKQNTGGPE